MTEGIRSGRPGPKPKIPLRDMRVGEVRMFEGYEADHIAKRYYMYKPMRFTSKTIMVRGVIMARTTRIA